MPTNYDFESKMSEMFHEHISVHESFLVDLKAGRPSKSYLPVAKQGAIPAFR